MMDVKPGPEHQWLKRLVGQWTYHVAGGPSENDGGEGTESFRPIGELWVVGEGRGEMGGAPAETQMTLGFDPRKGRFVGSWIGSMMTEFWLYDGQLDSAGQVLTLDSEGPSMTGDGTRARYQDIIEFQDDDHRTLTARTQGAGGQWQELMKVHYRRRRQ